MCKSFPVLRRPSWLNLVCCLAMWIVAASAHADQAAPAVAAAADLKFALPEIARAFEREGGRKLRLSFGSSGMLAQQIMQGAPFELFFSADESYVAMLQRNGRGEDGGRPYALGRIALFIPNGSPVHADRNLRDLTAAVRDGRLKRLAIANPEHAPYGRAAREALQHLGIWEALGDKLVLGENAAQAAQFAASGSAQAGIIPLSLTRATDLATRGAFVTLPEAWHAPLRQRMVLVKGAGDTARQFQAFMQTPAARAILERHGFASIAEQ